jgi:hypothetical protein
MTPDPHPEGPVRDGSRDGAELPGRVPAGRLCPICQTDTVPPRARSCSDACKQRAYRLRRTVAVPTDLPTLAATSQPRQALVAPTVDACPACETRRLGARRCPDCHIFCRRLGLGGLCPHSDAPSLLAEILPPEVPP